MAADEPQVIQSKRNKDMLVFKGFAYTKGHSTANGAFQHWICDQYRCVARCPAKLTSRNAEGKTIFVSMAGDHNHLPAPERILAARARGDVRKHACDESRTGAQLVVADSIAGFPAEALAALPSNRALKQTVWRTRFRLQQGTGQLSDELADYDSLPTLTIPHRLTHIDDVPFLAFDSGATDGDQRALIFATRESLEFLAECEVWLSDGMFTGCPELFTQMYTVHGACRGYVVPAVFALLPNKKTATYQRLWHELFRLTGTSGAEKTLLLDFEHAAYVAAQHEFPDINLGGCFFHSKQALHRRVQERGFAPKYAKDFGFRLRVAELGALAFLPQDAVTPAFVKLAASFPPDERVIVEYFEKTWIGRMGANGQACKPLFPLALWSVHTRVLHMSMLTNNMAEVFHKHFRRAFAAAVRPTFPALLSQLQSQQRVSNKLMADIKAGASKRERPTTVKRMVCLSNLVREYLENHDAGRLVYGVALNYIADQ